jgi:hypothetical protein
MSQTDTTRSIGNDVMIPKLKPRFPKVRRKIQRIFLTWLERNQSRFEQPLQFIYREDEMLEMGIAKLNPAVTFVLNGQSLDVSVNWQGICWDYLVCFDTAPRPSAKGYYCALYMPEHRVYYPNRQDLWQAEMFEPFLDWLNTQLIPAQWLGLYDGNGCTLAELLQEPDSKASVILTV